MTVTASRHFLRDPGLHAPASGVPSGVVARCGFSLVELLVGLVLLVLVIGVGWTAVSAARRTLARLVELSEVLETAWVAERALGADIRGGIPGRDVQAVAGDSLPLRAFRGTAVRCSEPTAYATIHVRYGGLRRPDPTKDSILALDEDGAWRTAHVAAVSTTLGACPGGGEVWTLDRDLSGARVARVFERGTYHLAGGALRYARGAGGRQPLTLPILDPGASRLSPASPGVAATLGAVRRWTSDWSWSRTFRPIDLP